MAKQALIMTVTKVLIDWNVDIDYTTMEPETYRPAEHTIITVAFTNPPANWKKDVWFWCASHLEFEKVDEACGNLVGIPNYSDPWESLSGDELFADDFVNFVGWTVHSGVDTTTSPSIDTPAGIFRAKGANPCVDATMRPRGIVVMPDHTASNVLSINRDIATDFGFDGDGDWTIVAKVYVPHHRVVINNSISLGMGLSLPASNNLQRNSVELYPLEQDAGPVSGVHCHRVDNGSGADVTEWNDDPYPSYPNGLWIFMYHKSGEGTVDCFFNIDGGRTLDELGTLTKDPATFTHLFFLFGSIKQMVTHPMIELCYVRVYQSIKTR